MYSGCCNILYPGNADFTLGLKCTVVRAVLFTYCTFSLYGEILV